LHHTPLFPNSRDLDALEILPNEVPCQVAPGCAKQDPDPRPALRSCVGLGPMSPWPAPQHLLMRGSHMRAPTRSCAISLLVATLVCGGIRPADANPEGTMTWAVHITLASRWLDPAETEGIITPFMVLYALHDALVKPMPAGLNTPSLAESWTESKDGLTYEFVIRKGVKFHNGDPVTAADVKFSFERYKGAVVKLLKQR